MAKTSSPLLPTTAALLRQFGDRLRLARLRRRLTAKQVSERAGMAVMTLRGLERGGPGVTMGAYLAVMQVLGMEKDLNLLGKADPQGREMQDARLPASGRNQARSRAVLSVGTSLPKPSISVADATARANKKQPMSGKTAAKWVEKGGFASSETLATLINSARSTPKKRR